ncbi:MAG: LysE family translocator [Chloroflexi bacterium]|nr:MAG: LysE family translocator [Chloroflexota bacterium]
MNYVLLGLTLGLAAGISPGPLLTLVITASLRSGLAGGLLVAVAPLITDLPIILLAVFALNRTPAWALPAISAAGGLVVMYIGVEILRSARTASLADGTPQPDQATSELWRGALVNALNPHPYLFWATVGAPTLLTAWRDSSVYPFGFLVGFYLLLVGSKMAIAWLIDRRAGHLPVVWYRRTLLVCGMAMIGLGLLLLRSAVPS